MWFNKKKFMFKAISFILILILPLFSLSCSTSNAYADSNEKGCPFVPFEIIKDNIKVGDIDSILIGYDGFKIEDKTYFSYYEITPKAKDVYYKVKGSSDYWDAKNYELNFLNSEIVDDVQGQISKNVDTFIKKNKDVDFATLDPEELQDLISTPFMEIGMSAMLFLFGLGFLGIGFSPVTVQVSTSAAVSAAATAAGKAALASMGLCGAFVIGVSLGLFIEWLNYTGPYWSVEMKEVGFKDGRGVLNIGDCAGDDDGVSLTAMSNNEIAGFESAEWIKNQGFDLKAEYCNKINRIILTGGKGSNFLDWAEEKWITDMLNKYQKINNDIFEFMNKKSNEAIKKEFMKDNDIDELCKAFIDIDSIVNNDKLKKEKYNNIKSYIFLKSYIISYADEDSLKGLPEWYTKFYLEALIHIKQDDYQWVKNESMKVSPNWLNYTKYVS